jgi:hypothetical protein
LVLIEFPLIYKLLINIYVDTPDFGGEHFLLNFSPLFAMIIKDVKIAFIYFHKFFFVKLLMNDEMYCEIAKIHEVDLGKSGKGH